VSENSHHSKGHACEVTEGVSDEDLGRELVVRDEAQCNHDEGDDDSKREYVV
jgi:hypothetical protein